MEESFGGMFKLPNVEVEDEGHASVQRHLAADTIWRYKNKQDLCRDLGGNASLGISENSEA